MTSGNWVAAIAAAFVFTGCAGAERLSSTDTSALTSSSTDGGAQRPPGPGGPGGPGGCHPPGPPPQEALDACQGKAAQDACSFTLDGNTLNGKCLAPPDDATKPLACVPPPPPPPQEAIDACAGKSVGDACSFTHDGNTLNGKCGSPPGGTLACVPPPPPPPGPPPQEALNACQGKAAQDACSFTLDGNTVNGVCLAPPDDPSQPLACAPPPPPH